MSTILFWNCRCLGSPEAVRSLSDLIRNQSPDIVFLSETKRWASEMRLIQRKLSFAHGVWVNAVGRSRVLLCYGVRRWIGV